MNRLERIKKKIDNNREESVREENYDLTEDTAYLLQRLEITQKALEKALEIDGYIFVKDALDQLKE